VPDSQVVQRLQEFKRRLAAMEAVQQREMARRWLNVEQALEGNMQALAQQVADLTAKGVQPGDLLLRNKLYRMERYKVLMAQTRNQLKLYADYAGDLITRQQRTYAEMGISDAYEMLRMQTGEAGLRATFGRMPVSAVEDMIGRASDGNPLRALLAKSLTQDTVEAVTQAIVDNIALGKNPRELALKMIAEGYDKGLNRALLLARDQQLRAYRSAADAQAQTSGLVTYKVRLAAKDEATCLACLAADGERLEVDEPMYDHPQGRCTEVFVVEGLEPPEFQRGPEWFAEQDEATQRAMMGDKRYEAWKDHKFDFTKQVGHTHDETWGAGLQVKSIADAIKATQEAANATS
jgi:hypothetical protein